MTAKAIFIFGKRTLTTGVFQMESQTIEKLEAKFEKAIAEVFVKMGLKKLPLLPTPHTMHLMAKAAVTVYEAAVENHRPQDSL